MSAALPPSASEQIREAVRKLAGTGVNLTDKAFRVAKAKELAAQFKVDYNTAVKAYDKALKDAGQQPPSAPPASVKTIGGVQVEVKAQPKEPQKGGRPAEVAAPPQAPGAPLVKTPEQKEADRLLFTELIKAAATGLYDIADSAWSVKVKRPEPDSFKTAGQLWADCFEAYGWETPKVLLLLGSAAFTAQLIALPLLQGRTEALKANAAKEEAEAKLRTQGRTPQAGDQVTPSAGGSKP